MSVWASMDLVSCDKAQCTGCEECGAGVPYQYFGSHVLPESGHYRKGMVDAASLSKFVRFNRENPNSNDNAPNMYDCEPWLRLSINTETVIVNKEQVQQMVDRLSEWLKDVD